MSRKRCSKCSMVKPFESFNKQKAGKYGYNAVCRVCFKIHYGYHTWSKETKEKCFARTYAFNKKNPSATLLRQWKLAVARKGGNSKVSDIREIWAKQEGRCALSNIKLTWRNGTGRAEPSSVTIDRIDNDRGYDIDNVRLVCFAVNSFRGHMTDSQLFELTKTLYFKMRGKR